MLPRDVARYLETWAYHPMEREDFAQNFLSRRIALSADRGDGEHPAKRVFASLCGVPRGRPIERVSDLVALSEWLEPNARQYDPPGIFLPFQGGKRFTSQGVLLFEEDYRSSVTPRELRSYLLVCRDGYVEYGRQGGAPISGDTYYFYAPLVAWIQRFAAFVSNLRAKMEDGPEYAVVLNLSDSEDARLCALGHGWREPWEAIDPSWPPRCLEPRIQISHVSDADKGPGVVAKWFAERIANAFGEGEPRCFNHPQSQTPAELPADKVEFR